ncbi:MAG TPA: pyridoxamine 5'-phosphate oxidase [Aestuariivirgaceae bacterium]|nr:pyridoxamine 5'-phosphate oxidase [Aestuariivirgaceae bacterium]
MVDPVLADDFTQRDEPLALFQEWYAAATLSEPNDPNAMGLATVDASGMPNLRMVLLKDLDPRGLTFYTNLESAKGVELLATPKAAACFHWKSLRRQIRFRGTVEPVADEEADQYFVTRPRQSRIGAWASAQSRPLESRFALERAVAKNAARFALGDVPRPVHWSGFRILPVSIEFWHDRPFRLHDRLLFSRSAPGEPWTRARLYP